MEHLAVWKIPWQQEKGKGVGKAWWQLYNRKLYAGSSGTWPEVNSLGQYSSQIQRNAATERETKNRQCMGEQERAPGSSSGGAQRIYRWDPSDLMAQHQRPRGFDSIGSLQQNRPTKSYPKNSKSKQLAGWKTPIGILLPLSSCLVRTTGYFYLKQARLY